MCTVSLLPTPQGVRLVSNRDEKRSRPRATLPSLHQLGARRMLAPIDPQGLGSWIGVSDAGLIVTLLNQTPPHRDTHPSVVAPRSRGELVLRALSQPDIAGIAAMLGRIDQREYGGFVLIAVSREELLEASSADKVAALSIERGSLSTPRVWSSSSLGDSLVVRPRAELFAQVVLAGPSPKSQDAFHDHVWPQRTWQSVLMERADARTVSTTACELLRGMATMSYTDRWDPHAPHTVRAELS
jgi:hypothetical protein